MERGIRLAWQNYSDLLVWQKGMDLVDEIYHLTKLLPREEIFALSDQMRRAAVSIPSNIAEGNGRKTKTEFRQFLSIANGSLYELETQIMICLRQRYIAECEAENALSLCKEVGKMMTSLILAQNRDP